MNDANDLQARVLDASDPREFQADLVLGFDDLAGDVAPVVLQQALEMAHVSNTR